MVVELLDEEQANRLFKALADPTRRDIVERTMRDDHSVSALASSYEMSFAAVQKHVAVLERAGIVTKHPKGREQLVRSNIDTIRKVRRLLRDIEALWRDRIDRFGEILAEPDPGDDT